MPKMSIGGYQREAGSTFGAGTLYRRGPDDPYDRRAWLRDSINLDNLSPAELLELQRKGAKKA